jgi:hypothetical protein
MAILAQMSVQVGSGWGASSYTIQLAEQVYGTYYLRLRHHIPLADLLSAKFWLKARAMPEGSLIRVVMPTHNGEGRDFDFMLVCMKNIGAGGPMMALWPHAPGAEAKPEEATNQPRLEHHVG